MALDRRRDVSSFGWAVGCGGRNEAQVRDDVRALVDTVATRWKAVFPADQGYALAVSSPAGSGNGAHLEVSRGDFRASVSVESILDPNRKSREELAIRMFGRAESLRLADLDRESQRMITRFRAAGISVGIAVVLTSLWLAFGVAAPIYVLGGLLMVVVALLVTTLGSSVGGFVGERIVGNARAKATTQSAADARFQEGLRRFSALCRELSAQRQALTGRVGAAPFRALPAATRAANGPARALAKPALSTSFSFSS